MGIQLNVCKTGTSRSSSSSSSSSSPIKSTLNSDATPSKRQQNQYKNTLFKKRIRTHTASHKVFQLTRTQYPIDDKMQTKNFVNNDNNNIDEEEEELRRERKIRTPYTHMHTESD